jgi:hypothetical protein
MLRKIFASRFSNYLEGEWVWVTDRRVGPGSGPGRVRVGFGSEKV